MESVVFLVGAPGVGKTSLARELFRSLDPSGVAPYLCPKPKWTIAPRCYAAAGHYVGGTFDGADTVPYNGVIAALEHWATRRSEWEPKLTLFDGDRFSHEGALRFVEARASGRVSVVLLVAPDDVLEARRRERGSNQNATWLKGRVTKARRFADLAASTGLAKRVELDTRMPAVELAAQLLELVGSLP